MSSAPPSLPYLLTLSDFVGIARSTELTETSAMCSCFSGFALLAVNVNYAECKLRGDNQEVLPLVLRMASDPVPNIRFNVSKTLEKMAPRLEVGTFVFFCRLLSPPPCFAVNFVKVFL